MSDACYDFSASTGDHKLSFTEVVPSFWVRRDGLIKVILYPALIFALLVAAAGRIEVAIVIAAIGTVIIGVFGGWDNKFPCTVTANQNSGQVTIASRYRLHQHGPRKGSPHVFSLSEIASVERSSYADEYPDTIAAWSRSDDGTAQSNLSTARNSWVIRIIFSDGQEINAAWQSSKNDAALLQKGMRDMFSKARENHTAYQVQVRHRAALGRNEIAL